jgi:hypothetical protein
MPPVYSCPVTLRHGWEQLHIRVSSTPASATTYLTTWSHHQARTMLLYFSGQSARTSRAWSACLSTLCLLAVQRVGYCYDPVCLFVCPHKTRNCEETERRTKKVLEIKVVGYRNSYSGVPSVVTSDDV